MTEANLLVLVLTRRCDLRCGFCPQEPAASDMDPAVIDEAIASILPRLPGEPRLKLFGGEPLLRPDLVARALDAAARAAPRAAVELSTHGGGVAAQAGLLSGRPRLEVFASRPAPAAGRLPGSVLNVLLSPRETPLGTAERVARGCAAGFLRFNFLPAYFTPWSEAELGRLRERFAAARRMLELLRRKGRRTEVANLSRRTSTPLYNDGVVVDTDGRIYVSSLVLASAVAPRRGDLCLGRVGAPLARGPRRTAAQVLEDSFPKEVLDATFAADALLSEFCRDVTGGRRAP